MKLWTALCVALLVAHAAATLRPRSDVELTGLAPPSEGFFGRYPPENETVEGPFFSRGVATPPTAIAAAQKRVVVEKPVVIPFGRVQDSAVNGSTYRARRFVINNLDSNKASFLLYPYEFSYDADGSAQDNTTLPENFLDGAFISTLPSDDFPKPNEYYFHWVNMSSNIDLSKAKAVYDMNVAILQVQMATEDGVVDVTYESDQFCTMFYTYIYGKYSKCFTGTYDYDRFVTQNPTLSQKSYVMYVNPDNITRGVLAKTSGENRFGILIIPDIAFNRRSYVATLLNAAAANIRDFVSRGGVIVTSGKAAMLLENLALITAGSFSTTNTLRSPGTTWAYGNGCDGAGTTPADDSEAEFVRRTLCFTAPRDGSYILSSITSAPLLSGQPTDLTPLAWYDTTLSWAQLKMHNEGTGADSALPLAATPRSYPMLSYKPYGKGFVVANLANPGYNFGTNQWIYNAFFLAGSRPLVLDNEVVGGFNRTIPALEQVKLQVKLKLTNYFTLDVAGAVTISVWYRNGTVVKFLSGSGTCTEGASTATPPSPLVYGDRKFDCSLGTGLAKLSSQNWLFSVYVEDAEVTQAKDDVLLLWPRVQYTDPRGSTSRTMEYGVTIGAATAALLRAEMNIDPSSMYPLHADGSYVDNVMNVENKEMTAALEVKHISMVPIITPFIDINDQIRLAHYLVFDQEYYKQSVNKIATWNYPYNANDVDYLEWDLLYNRSNVLAASWDEAAKLGRVPRSSFPIPPSIGIDPASIMNAEYQTNNDNDEFLLRQADFRDADKFYEHATQRLMAFLDVNEAEAAKTYWGSVPATEAMASDATRGKRRVFFARHDVFFWKKYPQPSGIPNRTALLTLDRYAKQPACGSPNQATVAGAFGNAVVGGLIPREWPNELMLDCNRRPLITPAELETSTGGKAKIVHYLVGIDPLDGSEAGDFYGFDPVTGQYQDYPEVKFVKAFRSKFDVAPDVSRRGGEMIFTFSTAPWSQGLTWGVNQDFVQVAADQISVYKISVEADGKLHIRFKRGNMPNENYGQASHLQLFIEQADAWTALSTTTATFNLKELQYDVSAPSTNFEDWSDQTVTGQSITLTKIGAFSMPAARLEFILGDTLQSSIMQPYELREPMVRYGVYEQELLLHRAVHGSAEFHPINEPCLVSRNGGFSAVTHIGTSSVPFREYLTTGTSLMIPAAPETGRVEWKDIWGRQWVQNVRSTIFEYPPIPPPLRNFVMTTTYELLTTSGQRLLDWRSEDKLDVRVQMKLLNNYPKWFEVTNCKANEVLQLCGEGRICERSRIFSVDTTVVPPTTDDDNQWIFQGHNASYGICFRDPEVYLSGVHLTDVQRAQIQAITLCAVEVGTTKSPACQNIPTGLPTVSRRTGNGTGLWNWAKQVLDYWPENYIKDNMWDLQHYDYDDNWYSKAYPYHMDNNLPHLTDGIVKPENIIAFPLYKGLGYSMTYDKTHSNPKFGSSKKGWWSDNLQNRDRTLVAGQAKANDVSVGQPSQISDAEWIDITNLQGVSADLARKLGNVYTCRFNRRQPKVHPENPRGFWLQNVYENNIVPVPPNFVPAWETGYDCSDGVRYSPNNISQFPNIVYTETARDWLYFAANLRGGALEDINVLYTLAPLATATGTKFEGVTKVQDGGRFTYWNPANSRNSYLIVDNPVSNVLAMRNDIKIEQEVIPTFTTTFDALVFHHLTVTDPEEIEREWELPVYTRSYGYGDFAVSVYVGDAGTTCLLQPGGSRARVKYTVMSNAGFDIYMLKNAINSTFVSQEAINSNDLMFNLVHTLRQPEAYNFIKIHVPEAIAPYITLTPSSDVVGIAGLFFDFESINVDYWRDGWKGDYYLDLKVKSNFPDSLRGRMYDLEVELDPKYFDRLPGVKNDPTTGVHDYTSIKFPPISFAVPYNNALWSGKVFWTSGYATAVSPKLRMASGWNVEGARFATLEEIDNLRMCLAHGTDPTMSESDGEIACMESVWATIPATRDCAFLTTPDAASGQSTVDFATGFAVRAPMFPVPVPAANGPDEAELHLLVRTNAAQLPSGYPVATHWVLADYLDWSNKAKTNAMWSAMTVHAKGAHLDLGWSVELMSSAGFPLKKQDLKPADTGLADITVMVTNTGDFYAYNVNFTLNLNNQVSAALPGRGFEAPLALPDACKDITPDGSASTVLYCFVAKVLVPQSPVSFVFRISFGKDEREGAGPSAKAPLNMHVLADNAFGYIDLTSSVGERTVRQDLDGPYGLKYTSLYGNDPQAVLTGKRDGTNLDLKVTHSITGITHYVWLSRLPDVDTWTAFYVTTEPTHTADLKERQEALGTNGLEFDFKVILTTDTSVPSVDSHPSVTAETNVLEIRNSRANLLLLLLILPGVVVPAAIGAAVFLLARGKNVKPAQSLGYGRKAAYVAQEMEPEPEPQPEPAEEPAPAPATPQYTAASVEPSAAPSTPAASQGAAGAHGTALPYGPTYVRAGGRPVNIVDSAV